MPDKMTTTILVVDDSAFDRVRVKQCLVSANPQIFYAFHEADWGRETGRQDKERNVAVATKSKSRQSIRRHCTQENGKCTARNSYKQAVHEIMTDATPAEHKQGVVIGVEVWREDPQRRPGKCLLIGFHRSRDHHIERKQGKADESVSPQIYGPIAQSHDRARRRLNCYYGIRHLTSRYSRRRTKICATMVTTMIITTAWAAA